MAYADTSPRKPVETEAVPKQFPPKPTPKKRAPKCSRAPTEASIWPQNRAAGITKRKASEILRSVAARLGQALREGLLDPPKKAEPKPIDPILWIVDRARAVRALVGRVDISGDSDGASWAKIIQGRLGRELHVYYRHGREVLVDVMAAVEAALVAGGAKIRTLWKRIERARQFGGSAFVAIIPLLSEPVTELSEPVTKKPRPRRKLSANSRAPA